MIVGYMVQVEGYNNVSFIENELVKISLEYLITRDISTLADSVSSLERWCTNMFGSENAMGDLTELITHFTDILTQSIGYNTLANMRNGTFIDIEDYISNRLIIKIKVMK